MSDSVDNNACILLYMYVLVYSY